MEEIITNIRCTLISRKEICDLNTLAHDYNMIIGEDIPYGRFGFESLEKFLASIPSLSLTKSSDGHIFVKALPSGKVQHIVDLISRQKSRKRKQRPQILFRRNINQQTEDTDDCDTENMHREVVQIEYQEQVQECVLMTRKETSRVSFIPVISSQRKWRRYQYRYKYCTNIVRDSSLSLGSYSRMLIQVTCAVSPVEIWYRSFNFEEVHRHKMMLSEMQTYCWKQLLQPIFRVRIGLTYVAFFFGQWHRVRVLELTSRARVLCFFIDCGYKQLLPLRDIYPLVRKYRVRQMHLYVCRLSGLENLIYLPSTCFVKYLPHLVGGIYVAIQDNTLPSSEGGVGSLVLRNPVNNISVNNEIMNMIMYDSNPHRTMATTNVTTVFVCHVEPSSDVYVQVQSPGLQVFHTLMRQLNENLYHSMEDNIRRLCSVPIFVPPHLKDQVYFVRIMPSVTFQRCKIVDHSPDQLFIRIYFLDYGNCKVVKVANAIFIPMKELSPVLAACPPQAIRIRPNIWKAQALSDFVKNILTSLPRECRMRLLRYDCYDNVPICDLQPN